MSTADPIPAEIRDRIVRAREALGEAVRDRSNDYPALKRTLASIRRELADAYKAAYQHEPVDTAASFDFLDVWSELLVRAEDNEQQARAAEERRANASAAEDVPA